MISTLTKLDKEVREEIQEDLTPLPITWEDGNTPRPCRPFSE